MNRSSPINLVWIEFFSLIWFYITLISISRGRDREHTFKLEFPKYSIWKHFSFLSRKKQLIGGLGEAEWRRVGSHCFFIRGGSQKFSAVSAARLCFFSVANVAVPLPPLCATVLYRVLIVQKRHRANNLAR